MGFYIFKEGGFKDSRGRRRWQTGDCGLKEEILDFLIKLKRQVRGQ